MLALRMEAQKAVCMMGFGGCSETVTMEVGTLTPLFPVKEHILLAVR